MGAGSLVRLFVGRGQGRNSTQTTMTRDRNAADAPRTGSAWALVTVVAICCGIGFYAVWLNHLVYQHRQPIFDSMSYYSKLYRTMSTVRHQGIIAAVIESLSGSNTVAMPFLIGSILGPIVAPSRAIGVWIQISELMWMACSLVIYFQTAKRLSAGYAVLFSMPFLSLARLYGESGGLSDFRMDLSLLLMYASTCLWYLIATSTRRPRDFWMLGIVAGVAALFRATAPVYLLAALLPIVLLDLLRSDRRRQFAMLLMKSLIAASVVALWFYIVDFNYLYYYYAVWNTDAQAKLPWAQSIRHVEFAVKHIGAMMAVWLMIAYIVIFTQASLFRRLRGPWVGLSRMCAANDCRPLWMGIVPLAMLVFGGAGENPYVSIPAAFGLLLAAIIPLAHVSLLPRSSWRRWSLVTATAGCFLAAFVHGYQRHLPGPFHSMQAHQQVLQSIIDDSHRLGRTSASYAALHLYQLNATSLQNVLLFDRPDATTNISRTICDGVQLMPNQTFFRPAVADWQDVPGGDDDQKESALLAIAETTVDYLIVPEPDSAAQLASFVPHFVINRHIERLRRHLVNSGRWTPITQPIVNGAMETVRVWRNIGKTNRIAHLTKPRALER